MQIEIETGVEWIISQIKNDSLFRHQNHLLDAFKQSLIDSLTRQYEGHWYPHDPLKGSGFRALSFQSTARIEKLLYRAGTIAGIRHEIVDKLFNRLHDRILLINPGEVKVINTALLNQSFAQAMILHSSPVELDMSTSSYNVTLALTSTPQHHHHQHYHPHSPTLSSTTPVRKDSSTSSSSSSSSSNGGDSPTPHTPSPPDSPTSPPRSLEQQLWAETASNTRNTKSKNKINSPTIISTNSPTLEVN